MKTTLNVSDPVMERLRQESARTGRTMSELLETALRRLLEPDWDPPALEPLPTFSGGRTRADLSDRGALSAAMRGT